MDQCVIWKKKMTPTFFIWANRWMEKSRMKLQNIRGGVDMRERELKYLISDMSNLGCQLDIQEEMWACRSTNMEFRWYMEIRERHFCHQQKYMYSKSWHWIITGVSIDREGVFRTESSGIKKGCGKYFTLWVKTLTWKTPPQTWTWLHFPSARLIILLLQSSNLQ